jgi:hypothetical protein
VFSYIPPIGVPPGHPIRLPHVTKRRLLVARRDLGRSALRKARQSASSALQKVCYYNAFGLSTREWYGYHHPSENLHGVVDQRTPRG